MRSHFLFELIASLDVRVKIICAALLILLIVGVPVATYFAGRNHALAQAEDKYIRERDKNLSRIVELEQSAARHIDTARQLAAENALLRKQNEATAEILRQNDAKIAGDAEKFTRLLEERNEKLSEIRLDDNFDSQLCGLCADAERSGLRAFSFCGRCKANP